MADPSVEPVVSIVKGAVGATEVQLVNGSNKVYVNGTDYNLDLSGVATGTQSYVWPAATPAANDSPLVTATDGTMGWSPFAFSAKKIALYSTDTIRIRFSVGATALIGTAPALVSRFTFDPSSVGANVTYRIAASLSIPEWEAAYVGNIYVALRKIVNVDATTIVDDASFDALADVTNASIVIPHTTAETFLSLRQYQTSGQSDADAVTGLTTFAVVVYANPPNEVNGGGNKMDVQDITVTITDAGA